jgi:hypothetical protein
MATKSTATAPQKVPAKQSQGFFLNVANWLLSRLPWFRDRYEGWSHGKRILIGLLMYLIVLPVIPIVVGIVLYAKDPQVFRNSKAFPILGVIIAAWLGAFGLIAAQPAKVTKNSTTDTTMSQNDTSMTGTGMQPKDTSDTTTAAPSTAKKSVQSKDKSEATRGRSFVNCDAAFAAGVFNIPKTDPSYADHLDGDNDGIACEK